MTKCENIIPGTDRVCGQDSNGPFHIRFCSTECADRTNEAELSELGITPELMKEALAVYYDVRAKIDEGPTTDEESQSHSPSQSSPPRRVS